jgi:DNA-binding IclR family transcriptional regulator
MGLRAGSNGTVQSVDRALRVLEILSRRGRMGVTEVAVEIGVHKSNAHRMLATLVDHGFVEQEPETEKYRLGFGLVGLAGAVTAEIDVVRNARAVSQRLSEETGETVLVTTLVARELVVVHQASSQSSVLGVDWSGWRMPLHCTPGGKVMLADLPEEEREALLAAPLERFTDKTIVDPDELREKLREARELGYAYTVEELETGLNGVAAPIRRPGGQSAAAIGVYGPAFRLSADSLESFGETTRRAADEISRRLGFHG